MATPKEKFLKTEAVAKLSAIDPNTKALWGVMSVHHMIEHMADAFQQANGKTVFTGILSPEEKLDRLQKFVMSDVPFKENTKNILLPESPLPIRHENITDAYAQLSLEIKDFFTHFESEPGKLVRNPFFGDLDFDHWVSLLHKHVLHHLKQFGVEIN